MNRFPSSSLKRLLCLVLCVALVCSLSLACAASGELPELHCEAALVVHPDTGLILYAKNPDRQLPCSSLAKIMTAMLVLDQFPDLMQTLEVSETAIADLSGATTASLKAGEVLTVEQLLYCLLLHSAADAANVLAEGVSGNLDSFVEQMNERAEELSLRSTHFHTAYGKDDPQTYSTASDLAKLTQAALKNQTFRDLVKTQYKRIPRTNLSGDRYYFSNNALVISSAERRQTEDYYYRYASGVMTGYSSDFGYHISALSNKSDMELVTIVLGAPRDSQTGEKYHYTDAKALMNWCYENLQYTMLLSRQTPVCEVPVALSASKDAVTLIATEDLYAVIPTEVELSMLDVQYDLSENLEAPLTTDDILGQAVFSYDGVEYARCDLHPQSDVDRSIILLLLHRIMTFLSGRYFKLALLALLVLGLLYFLLALYLNKKRHRSRRRRSRPRKRYR
ncbi:MAG: D-alanyl-D-alanine carboxypeptidase [Clostridia bacterium]|nr:D-alanyl-D-alanine carboxypeptidase [Clostridia bacterium]